MNPESGLISELVVSWIKIIVKHCRSCATSSVFAESHLGDSTGENERVRERNLLFLFQASNIMLPVDGAAEVSILGLSWGFELCMFRNLILSLQSVSFKLSGGKWSSIPPRDILLILSLDSLRPLDTRSTLQISHLTDSLGLDGLSLMARNCAARPKPEAHARCQDKQFWPQTLGSLISDLSSL